MWEKTDNGTMMCNSNTGQAIITHHTEYIASRDDMRIEMDLREERITLKTRVFALQTRLSQIQKDNSILKMKATMTLGSMQLQLESLEEDKQFLIEKCVDLKKKMKLSQQDFKLKQAELSTLQSTKYEA